MATIPKITFRLSNEKLSKIIDKKLFLKNTQLIGEHYCFSLEKKEKIGFILYWD